MEDFITGTPQIGPRFDQDAVGRASFQNHWHTALEAPVILVVEDDWLLRQAIMDELSAEGFITREAESGETALEILARGESIDLLITDVNLGGKADGWHLAQAFRAKDRGFPVIYVSGNTPLDDRQVAGSVFLTKPCVMTKLVEACRTLTAKR
jgi:DNA-binding response OmpR family regulator